MNKNHNDMKILKTLSFIMLVLLVFSSNAVQAQNAEKAIKGVIKDVDGPVENATVVLKGTDIYATTNSEGKFIFPKLLKVGVVLEVVHLGYTTVPIIIKQNTSFINLELTDYVIEVIGVLRMSTDENSDGCNH